MHLRCWRYIALPALALSTGAWAQQANSCASQVTFKAPGFEISKAAPIAAGTTEPNPKHAHYKGQGEAQDAKNFECR